MPCVAPTARSIRRRTTGATKSLPTEIFTGGTPAVRTTAASRPLRGAVPQCHAARERVDNEVKGSPKLAKMTLLYTAIAWPNRLSIFVLRRGVETGVHTMGDEEQATPTLDAADMALLAELGDRRQVREGEYLYREGDATIRVLRRGQRRDRHRGDGRR